MNWLQVDAVNRVFRCLEALDVAERPLSLVELQMDVKCPASSLASTLRMLVTLGYLHHDRSRRTYAPTLRLADLGGWVATRFAPGAGVQEAARAIRQRTGDNVAIAHRNDIRLQYLFFLPGKDLEPAVRVGTTRVLCRSGLGWALMSLLSNRDIQRIVRRTNATLAHEDRVDLDPLLERIETCRRDGYVYAESTVRAGYSVIAMPLRTRKMDLAIGVSGLTSRIHERRSQIVEILRDALAVARDEA